MSTRNSAGRFSLSPQRFARRAALLLLLAVMGCLLTACGGPQYTMRVESFVQPVSFGKRYVILPGLMDVKASDQGFQAVAAQLDGMLASKGYVKAESIEQADLGLYVVYGVREHRGEGFKTTASLSLAGTLAGVSQGGASVSVDSSGSGTFAPFTHSGMFVSGTSQTANPLAGGPLASLQSPLLGAAPGQAVAQGPARRGPLMDERVFVRALEIEAVDLARYKANDPANIVWKISLVSRGSTVSLEKAMPYFLAVLSEYIGKRAFANVQVTSDYTVSVVKPEHPNHHRP